MDIALDDMTKKDRKFVKELYKEAFPPEERAPFYFIKRRHENGKARMLVAKANGKPVGLSYLVESDDLVYLFFLAVSASERGKGYGTKILSIIKEITRGKRLFLTREQIDENADNNAMRISRREFYMRNGFCDGEYRIKEANVVYDMMTIGGSVSPEEYRALMEKWAGKFILRFVDMRLLPPEN